MFLNKEGHKQPIDALRRVLKRVTEATESLDCLVDKLEDYPMDCLSSVTVKG